MNYFAALLVATALSASSIAAFANNPNRSSAGERVYGWLEKAVVLPVAVNTSFRVL